jgi:hypothetical protein
VKCGYERSAARRQEEELAATWEPTRHAGQLAGEKNQSPGATRIFGTRQSARGNFQTFLISQGLLFLNWEVGSTSFIKK